MSASLSRPSGSPANTFATSPASMAARPNRERSDYPGRRDAVGASADRRNRGARSRRLAPARLQGGYIRSQPAFADPRHADHSLLSAVHLDPDSGADDISEVAQRLGRPSARDLSPRRMLAVRPGD